jgi:hypothetical protein
MSITAALTAALSDASLDGACRLLLSMSEGWQAIVPWIEQLMEESLGKGNKGVVVFTEQLLNRQSSASDTSGTLHVQVTTGTASPQQDNVFVLSQPSLASQEPRDRLAAVAASFLGWQLSMALYGYLQHITFAGQPAVENYKARARVLPTGCATRWIFHRESFTGSFNGLFPFSGEYPFEEKTGAISQKCSNLELNDSPLG